MFVRKLGLDYRVDTSQRKYVAGYDGATTSTLGKLNDLTIKIGNLAYIGSFTVVRNLSTYEVILGVPFLEAIGIHDQLKQSLGTVCGEEVINKGN